MYVHVTMICYSHIFYKEFEANLRSIDYIVNEDMTPNVNVAADSI